MTVRTGTRRTGLALRAGGVLVLVVLVVLAARSPAVSELLDREKLIALLEQLRAAWWSPLALIALFVVVSVGGLPASPVLASGAAVFGFATGSVLNTVGLFAGAAASFGLGHVLGRDLVVHFTGPRLRRAEKILAKRGFWPLVQTRFLPLPFALVNYGCALAGVPSARFLTSTLLGLIPATTIHTYFIARLVRVEERPELLRVLVAYGVVLVLFNVALAFPTLRERRRRRARYQELLERRRARPDG